MNATGLLGLRRGFRRHGVQTAKAGEQSAADCGIFPLRLSPTEICWLLEDCPSHPMQFFLRLRFDGRFQRGALEQALETAVARHPLLTTVVQQTGKRRWDWVPSKGPRPQIHWKDSKPDDNLPPAERIDICREPGLQATVTEDEDCADLVLQFQHTVCDGLSASEVTGDILTAYANLVAKNSKYRFKRLELTALRARAKLNLPRWQLVKWLARHAAALHRFRRCYKRRPISIVSHARPDENSSRSDYPESFFHHYSRAESVAIQRFANEAGTTVNSLLLRDMFLTFRQWRCDNESTQESDVLRLTMPVSMRTAADRTMPAANVVSLACLDRTVAETIDARSLLRSIDAEIEEIRTKKRGLVFSLALRVLQFWPSQLAAGLRRKRFSGSALLTNIGPALANCHLPRREGKLTVGDLSLERVEFLPVLRPDHCVTVGATTYAGRIVLGMHYDSRVITIAKAQQIFDRLIRRFRNTQSNHQGM